MKKFAGGVKRRVVIVLISIIIGVPLVILGVQSRLNKVRTIDIVAAIPENGGFQPSSFKANAGETVRLRITSPDTVHGIAIGPAENMDFGFVLPGETKEIEVTFSTAGRYTLYCNVWCSPTHWRMRAVIDVVGTPVPVTPDPIIERLAAQNTNIDALHPADAVFTEKPSAARGKTLLAENRSALPGKLFLAEWRQSHSPATARALLGAFNDTDAWDMIAALWLADISRAQRDAMATLYNKNCAACHGVTGNGDGIGATILAESGFTGDAPAAFTDTKNMLGASSDILYGKIRRGGMGTGMPGFGTIFTREQSAQLAAYLWTFVFNME